MSSNNDSDFVPTYQKLLFEENKNDLFKTADVKRKCIAQIFKTSSRTFNNSTTCSILNDMLTTYTDLVDDQNGINNYADTLKSLTSKITTKHCSKWQSNLDKHLNNIIKPNPCGEIICANSEITQDHLKILTQNLERNKKIESVKNETKPLLNKNPVFQKPVLNTNIQNQSSNVYKPNFKINNAKTAKDIQKETSYENDRYNMFKTAKEELHIQNVKKYGKQSGGAQQSSGLNYGLQKKSLGTRRGVQSKFVPPVKMGYEESGSSLARTNAVNYPEELEEVDERLRNIDAKMIELIRSEIMDSGPPIGWEDIAGLEFAKTAIKEAVVWPLLRPDIFTGLRRPPKGILLFGPPGTGKTLIGKCIASQSQSTFFSISASSLTSKWIGDGEKMVRAMFAVARCHQPAVIFIDEIDSLLSQRSDTEHESSRRIKTEFLVQLDGAATAEDDRILLVGATNRPQELDEAARRRFVKRLYIPLPENNARLEIVKRLMNTERNDLSDEEMEQIAVLSNGYSGADMKNLCSEASLGPIRSIDISLIQNIEADQVRPITMADFKSALNRVRASVSPGDLDQYLLWDKTYGSGGF